MEVRIISGSKRSLSKNLICCYVVFLFLFSLGINVEASTFGNESEGFGLTADVTTPEVEGETWGSADFGLLSYVTLFGEVEQWDSLPFGATTSTVSTDWSDTWSATYYNMSCPNMFTATNESTISMHLQWNTGYLTDTTYIRGGYGSYPMSLTDGYFVYNGSDASYIQSEPYSSCQYYYTAWGWKSGIGFTENNITATGYTNPQYISGLHQISNGSINITLGWEYDRADWDYDQFIYSNTLIR